MSRENLANKCKHQFKGFENFFRRIAFNLGNSPSQTDVKIVSCIPIDVSDLQQKIKSLEKELEATRCSNEIPLQNLYCYHHKANSGNCEEQPNKTYHNRSHTLITRQDSPCSSSVIFVDQTDAHEPKKGLFDKIRKHKSAKKKHKCNTHLVYYAQTEYTPFDYTKNPQKTVNKIDMHTISEIYLSRMLQKQYTASPYVDKYSLTSKFSSPICRDTDQSTEATTGPKQNESDLCSCLHGHFYNIDQYIRDKSYSYSYDNSQTTDFYDSSLYDMVPVKEVPQNPLARVYDSTKKRFTKRNIQATYIPESCPPRYRHQTFVNHNEVCQTPVYYSGKPQKIVNAREKYLKHHKTHCTNENNTSSANSCYIDCGDIYTKRMNTTNKARAAIAPVEPIMSVNQKSAGCLTTCMNSTECQTTTSQSVQIDNDLLYDYKTEDTLDQIKSILQTVLMEVKTNAQTKKEVVEKPTKDAIVQKDISQKYMPGCSSLLHSYSSHNVNPNLTSYSQQMSPGSCFPCGFGMMPGKYIHNFPVFVHTPGTKTYTCCYRHSARTNKTSTPQQAATAATNTDRPVYTTETEKLIKEIYKSIQIDPKDSASEYGDSKCMTRQSCNKTLTSSDIFNKQITPIHTSSHIILNRDFGSNTVSMRSQLVGSSHTNRLSRNSRKGSYVDNVQTKKMWRNNIIAEDYENTTSSSGDDDTTLTGEHVECYATWPATQQKTPRKNLFSKMLKKSIKLFGNRNKKMAVHKQADVGVVAEESEDNSDNSETIYNQGEANRDCIIGIPYSSRNAMRKYSHKNFNKRKNSPYLKQEYRRYWNAKLMSEKYKQYEPSEAYSRTPYWQNYETRSALVSRSSNKTGISSIPLETRKHLTSRVYDKPKLKIKPKGISWVRRYKPGLKCGKQWRRLILEN